MPEDAISTPRQARSEALQSYRDALDMRRNAASAEQIARDLMSQLDKLWDDLPYRPTHADAGVIERAAASLRTLGDNISIRAERAERSAARIRRFAAKHEPPQREESE